MNILLMGNPNVGKSVIFSKLTGTNVTASNYSGTTVEYTEGQRNWRGEMVDVIDVPGTYTLDPTNEAEEVAVDMLDKGDLVVNVLDATNLERNLNLTLQLLERDIPVIVVLNMWDEAEHKGIEIDIEKLEEYLGVPVITTAAVKNRGIKDITYHFDYREVVDSDYGSTEERWAHIGEIIEDTQHIQDRKHTFLEWFEDATVKPLTGIPIAIIFMYLSFILVRWIGEGLIANVTEPLFEILYRPVITQLSQALGAETFIHKLLIGNLVEGAIHFGKSFGILTTGIFIPFAAVLPYIIAFYLVLGILEDTGYLPRLATLVDNIMHRVGLHGFSIIPMILGLGCNVPGALAIRNLDSHREKFIASTLMAISVPCMGQIAMIFGLVGPHGEQYLLHVFLILVLVWFTVGLLMDKLMPGFSSDLLLEIPPFRVPSLTAVLKKLWMRMTGFLREAIPYMLFGVLIANLLYFLGVFDYLAVTFGPLLHQVFGLPQEAITALLIGFFRKDLAMGMLAPLNLTAKQLVVASTVLAVYFPCVATFVVLIKELGIFAMMKSAGIMLLTTLTIGGFVNFSFQGGSFSLLGWIIIVGLLIAIRYIPSFGSDFEERLEA